jgi:hypothetical protein
MISSESFVSCEVAAFSVEEVEEFSLESAEEAIET